MKTTVCPKNGIECSNWPLFFKNYHFYFKIDLFYSVMVIFISKMANFLSIMVFFTKMTWNWNKNSKNCDWNSKSIFSKMSYFSQKWYFGCIMQNMFLNRRRTSIIGLVLVGRFGLFELVWFIPQWFWSFSVNIVWLWNLET